MDQRAIEGSVLTATNVGSFSPGSPEPNTNESQSKQNAFIFPLFDELSRSIPPGKISVILVLIIQTIQLITHPYTISNSHVWNRNTIYRKIIYYATYIIDFGARNDSFIDTGVPILIIVLITIITLSSLIGLGIYYQNNKTFSKGSLYVVRFFVSYVIPIIIIPSYSISGFSYLRCFSGKMVEFTVATIVMILCSLIISYVFILDSIFRSATIYIENTRLSRWYSNTYSEFIIIGALYVFFGKFVTTLPMWTSYILISFFALALIKPEIELVDTIFIYHTSNTLFFVLAIHQQITPMLCFIPQIDEIYRIFVPLGIFVINYTICYFLLRRRTHSPRLLTDPSTEKLAIRAIRIIFATRPDMFMTWETMKQTSIYDSLYTVSRLTRITAFFPQENTRLKTFITRMSTFPNLSTGDAFLLYQARRAYIQRQSWSTHQANSDLARVSREIMTMTVSIQKMMLQFIDDRSTLTNDLLVGLAQMKRSIQSTCREAMDGHPNNPRIVQEYSRFMIECCSNFSQGFKWRSKAKMIELGRSQKVDLAFQRMVNLFPRYLTIARMEAPRQPQQNTADRTYESNTTSSYDVLIASTTNEPGSDIVTNPKLRVAYQKAVDNMDSSPLHSIQSYSILSFIVISVALVSSFVVIYLSTTERDAIFELSKQLYTSRSLFNRAFYNLLLVIPTAPQFNPNIGKSAEKNLHDTVENAMLSQEAFTKMIYYTALLSDQIDVKKMLFTDLSYRMFIDGKIHSTGANIINLFYTSISSMILSTSTDFTDEAVWTTNSGLIEIMINYFETTVGFNEISSAISESINVYYVKEMKSIFTMTICFVIIIAIASSSASLYLVLNFNKSVNKQLKVLALLPNDTIRLAAKPMTYSDNEIVGTNWRLEARSFPKSLLIISMIASTVAYTGIFGLEMWYDINEQTILTNLNMWNILASRRAPAVMKTLSAVTVTGLNETYDIPWLDAAGANYISISSVAWGLKDAHQELFAPRNESQSINSFSDELDKKHFALECQSDPTNESIYESYRCLSNDQLVVYFTRIANDLHHIFEINSSVVYDNDEIKETIHILNDIGINRLVPTFLEINDIIEDLYHSEVKNFQLVLVMILVGGIIITLLFSAVFYYCYLKLNDGYKIFKSILARIPPEHVAKNRALINLIIDKPSVNVVHGSLGETIVAVMKDPLIIIDNQNKIEFLNQSACQVFGYTTEQTIGRDITLLLPDGVAPTNGFTTNGVKDNGMVFSLEVSTMVLDNASVLILHDTTSRNKFLQSIDYNIKLSDAIFHGYLPKKLSSTLQPGSVMAFEAPYICSICLQISRFCDFVNVLSPQTILKTTEAITHGWDEVIHQYEDIDAIAIRGETYHAVCGAFRTSENEHSEIQKIAVSFALDCFKAIDEVNHILENNYQICIGITIGKHAVAGMFGNTTQHFSVISEATFAAETLTRSSKPSTIVAEKEMEEAFKGFDVRVEPTPSLDYNGKQIELISVIPNTV